MDVTLRLTDCDTERRFWSSESVRRAILSFDKSVTIPVILNNIVIYLAITKHYGAPLMPYMAACALYYIFSQLAALVAMHYRGGCVYYRHRNFIMTVHRAVRIASHFHLALTIANYPDVDDRMVTTGLHLAASEQQQNSPIMLPAVVTAVRLMVVRSSCIFIAVHSLQFFVCFRYQLIFQTIAVFTGMRMNTRVAITSLQHRGLRRLQCFVFSWISPVIVVPVGTPPAGAAANCSDEAVAVLAWTVRRACFGLRSATAFVPHRDAYVRAALLQHSKLQRTPSAVSCLPSVVPDFRTRVVLGATTHVLCRTA